MTREQFNKAVVKAARGWIGTPYHHQQSAKGVGVDCLGLVRGVWRELCGTEAEAIPNYGSSWKTGGEDLLLKALRRHMEPVSRTSAGRVLAFRYQQGQPACHVAIATSASTMIHAYHERAVMEVEVSPWWMRRCVGAFEFPMRGEYS
jgi:NlpC/P60 family putative phage cell wall peptidase